jgi:hypothetical protein
VHDLSLDQFAELTVYSNGGGTNINIDCHRAGSHSNLFSNINFGAGTRPFASGGASGRGAHSGANNTFWNLWANRQLALPPCTYGPMLTFVGDFGAVSAGEAPAVLRAAARAGATPACCCCDGGVSAWQLARKATAALALIPLRRVVPEA